MRGKLILNGEKPFIRLSRAPGGPFSSDASLWTITYSPRGAGHALFVRSELTDERWRIYADNRELVRWLQATVQGTLNPETAGSHIALLEAMLSRQGDLQDSWAQKVHSSADEITLTWRSLIEPLLMAHDRLINASVGRLRRLVAVRGRPRTRHGIRQVAYDAERLCWEPQATGFIRMVANGTVAIDFDAQTLNGRGLRNHHTQFKIALHDLPRLYNHHHRLDHK